MYVSFEQWTGKREVATLGTNTGSPSLPFQKWRHFKEAFAPEIVYEAVRAAPVAIETCIDPFGGSGTTALACQFLGVRPTTIEVNPYLADLIEAKLCAYDAERLAQDLGTVLRHASRMDATPLLATLPATFVEPGMGERWVFNRVVAERILALRLAIAQLGAPAHARLFKVLLGGVLVELSNTVVNGKGRRYRRGWDKRSLSTDDVDRAFTDAAAAAIGEIGRFGRRATRDYEVIRGDSREAISGRGSFDLAVFSPPYPNSFDYTDVYNIELWMLGYLVDSAANRTLRESTLASHVQIHRAFVPAPSGSQRLIDTLGALDRTKDHLWNPHIPAMVGGYFADLLGVTLALVDVLRPGGSIWAVVGDSRYAGVAVNVAEILAELCLSLGLDVDRVETLREMRASAQQGGQTQLAESLIVVRRP